MSFLQRILEGARVLVLAVGVALVASCQPEEEPLVNNGGGTVHHDYPTYTDPEVVTEENVSGGGVLSAFSVADGRQVMFARGNLQFQPSTSTWRFAGNQFDTIGRFNAFVGQDYNGWIDLFGWATSGYGDCPPWMTSTNPDDYGARFNEIGGTDYDWGCRNAISNGGDRSDVWRTLTGDEWDYLLNRRNNAIYLRAQAVVMGVGGIVLMPDLWHCPDDISFAPNTPDRDKNTYNKQQWIRLQRLGVVFLPAAGYRLGTTVIDAGDYGYYWSSSAMNATYARCLCTDKTVPPNMSFKDRHMGQSVRLVKDL